MSEEPGKFLRGGEFYSPVQTRLSSGGVLLSELCQPHSRSVPRHEHELAYITIVLRGDYLEGDGGKLDEMHPLTAVFNPAGVRHSTVIGPAGASFFTIEFRQDEVEALGLRLPEETTFDRRNGPILWPGLRLYSAFQTRTWDSLLLEGHVLELLAAISARDEGQGGAEQRAVPRWFRRVKDRLHEEFREPVRMRELASDAGVHPVHLARVFRRLERCTPREYQQNLQLRAACELLGDPDWPLAAIASECGFADQSHFTRMLQRRAGTTPARFRKRLISASHAA